MKPLEVGIVGAGYWGPNLVRNFTAFEGSQLRWVCDLDRDRARRATGSQSTVEVTDSLDEVLDDDGVEAVAVATPPSTHAEIAIACLEAGKHVLIEKPLAMSVAEGEKVISVAEERDLILMSDHTYCYTPAVRKIRELISTGALGTVQYLDSIRINLGLIQSDVDVFWDLAPHDLSILDFVLPEDRTVHSVAAQAADPIGAGRSCVGYLTLLLGGGAIAHVSVNWLSPMKVRTTIVGGSRRMVVWDDLHPSQRLSMYDKGVEMTESMDSETRRENLVSYRIGDVVSPALQEFEALAGVVQEFAASVRQHRVPLTDGRAALRVLRVLEAAARSLDRNGAMVPIDLLGDRPSGMTQEAAGAVR